MKTVFALIASCWSLLGADNTDIRVTTTTKTNTHFGTVTTIDVYTRGGQTNLVRRTNKKAGLTRIRVHRFYHEGFLIGDFFSMKDSSGFTTQANSPCSIGFEFGPTHETKSVFITAKDGLTLDAFTCTNGMFYPVKNLPDEAITVQSKTNELLLPEDAKKPPPQKSGEKKERMIEEQKEK
ncbi:MAG: hypothetical protein HY043_18540 [Verrucomicrobia bacterium]|nr:hypothetical protein [Verrucomicrobiota bacterium]